MGHVAGMAKRQRLSIKRTSVCNHDANHSNHQPSAPELLMPAEPVPKRLKVGANSGLSIHKRPSKRKTSSVGSLPKRRKQLDAEAIASIERMRVARAQVVDPRDGMDLNL